MPTGPLTGIHPEERQACPRLFWYAANSGSPNARRLRATHGPAREGTVARRRGASGTAAAGDGTFDDQVIVTHPSHGVKTPTVPKRPRKIISGKQFETLYNSPPPTLNSWSRPTSSPGCAG
jgi:hypothetical protein